MDEGVVDRARSLNVEGAIGLKPLIGREVDASTTSAD